MLLDAPTYFEFNATFLQNDGIFALSIVTKEKMKFFDHDPIAIKSHHVNNHHCFHSLANFQAFFDGKTAATVVTANPNAVDD